MSSTLNRSEAGSEPQDALTRPRPAAAAFGLAGAMFVLLVSLAVLIGG